MRARATTTVSILRGDTTNTWGDTVSDNSGTPVASGVMAAIHEQSRRTYLPAEQAYRIIRTYTGRLPSGCGVQKLDRLRDERTSAIYLVTELRQPDNPAITLDIAVDLSRTT